MAGILNNKVIKANKQAMPAEAIQAASYNNKEALANLFDQGIAIDCTADMFMRGPFLTREEGINIKQATPFMAACAHGHLELAKWLAERSPLRSIHYANEDGYNAAHVSAYNGYSNIVQYLVLHHDSA